MNMDLVGKRVWLTSLSSRYAGQGAKMRIGKCSLSKMRSMIRVDWSNGRVSHFPLKGFDLVPVEYRTRQEARDAQKVAPKLTVRRTLTGWELQPKKR